MAPKNYLITGAGRGIGRGLSRLLLKEGHRVALLDKDEDELLHTAQQIHGALRVPESEFRAVACDLRKPDAIVHAARLVDTFFSGHLDVLVNNAAYTGGVGSSKLEDLSLEEWNCSLETNLTAPMMLSQQCLHLLAKHPDRARGGCIINMSSTRAFMSEADNEAYASTKAGLLGLTQSMAVSLASRGVRVNAILPGWIHVENECKEADERGQKWRDGLTEEDHRWHLSGRVGRVEDVMGAVRYLTDEEFVTGAEMVLDGGVTRKMVYPE
ncbi:hypothetical protein MBLNU230_g8202t1 [Neophaeotheca triangularis]